MGMARVRPSACSMPAARILYPEPMGGARAGVDRGPSAWICLAASARAENRLALVIGNDDYQHIDKLQKAKADAKAYAAVLREKGFSAP